MNRWIVIAAVAIVVLAGGWFFIGENQENEKGVLEALESAQPAVEPIGEQASSALPDLTLPDLNGNDVRLGDLHGKPLVVNTWAAWCPFCVDELPDFATVQQELGDTVQIVAINRAESLGTARGYADDLGLGSDLVLLLDPADSFYTSIGGFAMPETLFINSDGSLNFHKRGVMSIDEIRQRVEALQ